MYPEMRSSFAACFLAATAFLSFLQGLSGQTISISSSSSVVSRGNSLNISLDLYDVGQGNTLLGIVGGYVLPSTSDVIPLVFWNDSVNSLQLYHGIAAESPNYTDRVSIPTPRILRIGNMSFPDQKNEFRFVMSYLDVTARTKTSSIITVSITVPATAFQPLLQAATDVVIGSTLTLECTFEGLPQSNITWSDSSARGVIGNQMNTDQGGDGPIISKQNMTISNIQKNESATYQCNAVNDGGSAQQSTQVNVQYSPSLTSFAPDNANPIEGTPVKFTCSADANPTPHSYYYFFNGIHMQTSSSSEWTVSMSNCSTTSGNFSCIAGNTIGNSSASFSCLSVRGLPIFYDATSDTTVNASSPLMLNCYAVGCPTPNVTWEKVGDTASQSQINQLFFNSVKRTDAGTYKCTATNVHDTATHNTVLTVNYAPVINLQVVQPVLRACAGERISMTCEADGVPVPNVSLLDGSTVLSSSTQGTTTYNLTVTDAMFKAFFCNASNMIASDQRTITVSRRQTASTPLSITVTPDSGNSLTVSWQPPVCIPGSGVTTYIIYARHSTTGDEKNFTATCDTGTCQHVISGLEADVSYSVSLVALDGSGQFGDRSAAHSAIAPPAKITSDDNDGVIIGVCVAAAILLIIIIIIIFYCCRKKGESHKVPPPVKHSDDKKTPLGHYASDRTKKGSWTAIEMQQEANGNGKHTPSDSNNHMKKPKAKKTTSRDSNFIADSDGAYEPAGGVKKPPLDNGESAYAEIQKKPAGHDYADLDNLNAAVFKKPVPAQRTEYADLADLGPLRDHEDASDNQGFEL